MGTTLLRKALRDMRSHMGAYLACAMVMAIGLIFYSSLTQVAENMPAAQEQFYTDYRFADAFADMYFMPAQRVERLEALEGVEKASGRLVTSAQIVDDARTGNAQLKLISYNPVESDRLNDIMLSSGSAPVANSQKICLTEGFYKANGLQPGDTIDIALRGKKISLTVAGSVLTPEYVYITPEGSIMPDDKNYGIAYVPLDLMESMLGRRGEVNDVSVRFQPGVVFDDMERALKTALAPNGLLRLTPRKDQLSHNMLTSELDGISTMVGVVPVVFLLLGALIMSVVIKRLVEQQHAQIGLMKAFGYGKQDVLGHYAIYGAVIGLLASIIGGALGALVAKYIAAIYTQYFAMPGISGDFSLSNVFGLSLLALAFGVGASIYGARGVIKLSAAQAMRPPTPISGKPILIERIRPLWNWFKSTTKLALRNLFRARSRSLLTWLGLTVCYALTAAVFAFSPMVDLMMNENFRTVQRYDMKVGLDSMTEARKLESTLRRFEGVNAVEAVLEIPVTVRHGAISKDLTLLVLPQEGTMYRLFDKDGAPVALPSEGVVLTYRAAEDLGIGPGDSVLLDIPYPDKEVHAAVAALSEQYMSNYLVASRSYAQALLKTPAFATSAMLTIASGEGAKLEERLKDASNVTSVMNIAQIQSSIAQLMETSMSMLYAMAVMAVFAGFAIVYNAGVVILSERTRELASMRILGFTLQETVRVVAYEQVTLVLLGILFGLPLTGYTMEALAKAVATDAFTMPTGVPLSSHVTAIACMLLAWLAAVAVMMRKVKRAPMADVLKDID